MKFKKGDHVRIRDYPFGKPINSTGYIVGILSDDHYNIKHDSGLLEGQIKKYKYWKLELTCSQEGGNV